MGTKPSEPLARENRLTLVEEQLLSLLAEVNLHDHEDLKAQVKRHALAGRMHSIILDFEDGTGLAQNGSPPRLLTEVQRSGSPPDQRRHARGPSFGKVAPLNVQKISATRPSPISSNTALSSVSTNASASSSTSESKPVKSLSTSAALDTAKQKSTPIRGNKSKPLPPQPSRLNAASVIHYLANRHLYVSEHERKVLTVVADAIEDEKYVDQELKNLVEKQRLGTLLYGPDYQPIPKDQEPSPETGASAVPVEERRDIPKRRINSVAPMSTPTYLAVPRPPQENSEIKTSNRSIVLIEKWTIPLPPEMRKKNASLDTGQK
ncbi:hypothetical protein H1R20_g3883, partial [Candolleomyces eurysporus]